GRVLGATCGLLGSFQGTERAAAPRGWRRGRGQIGCRRVERALSRPGRERGHLLVREGTAVALELDLRPAEDVGTGEADLLALVEVVQRDLVVVPRLRVGQEPGRREVRHPVTLDV